MRPKSFMNNFIRLSLILNAAYLESNNAATQQTQTPLPAGPNPIQLRQMFTNFFYENRTTLTHNNAIENYLWKNRTQFVRLADSLMSPSRVKESLKVLGNVIAALQEILEDTTSWVPRETIIRDLKAGKLLIGLDTLASEEIYSEFAIHDKSSYTLIINYIPGLTHIDHFKEVLLNQLFKYYTVAPHQAKGTTLIDKSLIESLIFDDRDSRLHSLTSKLNTAMQNGFNTIGNAKILWEKYCRRANKQLTLEEIEFIRKMIPAIKHYKPALHYTSAKDISEFFEVYGDERKRYDNGDSGFTLTKNDRPGYYARGQFFKGAFVYQYTTNPRSLGGRMLAFFTDMERNHTDREVSIIELAGTVAQLPSQILKIFFPDFKSYFEEYLSNMAQDSATITKRF